MLQVQIFRLWRLPEKRFKEACTPPSPRPGSRRPLSDLMETGALLTPSASTPHRAQFVCSQHHRTLQLSPGQLLFLFLLLRAAPCRDVVRRTFSQFSGALKSAGRSNGIWPHASCGVVPPNPTRASLNLSRYERDILWHTVHRAAGGYYCGGGPDMDALVEKGMMEYAGRKSFIPDPYYKITNKGREALRAAKFKPNALSQV